MPQGLDSPQAGVGDITAKVLGGNIYLSETPGFEGSNNGILVTQLSNGVIRISGISANGGPASLINGAAYQDFAWSGLPWESPIPHLFVAFGDGADKVEFSGVGEKVNLRDVVIDLGTDSADGSSDNDVVSIGNLHARGVLMVASGAGADKVRINHGTHVEGRVHLWTYDSNAPDDAASDEVRFSGLVRFEQFLDIKLGDGNDNLFVNAGTSSTESQLLVYGSMNVDAGGGDDDIYLVKLSVGGYGDSSDGLTVLAGGGADTIVSDDSWYANFVSIKTWDSLAESDADSVRFQRTYAAGDVAVDLGGGDDEFIAGDANDPAANYGVFAASLLVTTGAGADDVYIEGSDIQSYDSGGSGNLSIYTGAGADEVTVDFRSIPFVGGDYTPEVDGSLTIRTFDDSAENDVDRVRIPLSQVKGGVSIGLGAGDDVFDLLGGNFGWLAVDAGDGVDVGYMAGFIYQQGRIDMGAGNDHLTLGFLRKPYLLTLAGGDGEDVLHKTGEILADQVFEHGWEFFGGGDNGLDDRTNPDLGGGVIGLP